MTGPIARSAIRRATWLALLAVYVAAFAAGIFGVIAPADSGLSLDYSTDPVVVLDVAPASEAWYEDVRPGDAIVTINGRPAAEASAASERIVSFDVKYSDGRPAKTVRLTETTATLIDETVSLNILGLVFVLMGVFVFLRVQPTAQVSSFSFLAVAAGIALAVGPAAVAYHAWARQLEGIAVHVVSVFFLFFFFGFARKESDIKSRFQAWLPELGIAMAVLSLIPWAVMLITGAELFSALRTSDFLTLAISLVGGLSVLVHRYLRSDADTKEQVRIAALGTAVGLVPFLWLSLIPQLATGTPIVPFERSVLGLVLLPLGFGFAIMRHRLMGIRRLVHKGTAYALITSGIVIVYGLAITLVNWAVPNSESWATVELALLAGLFVSVPLLSSVRQRALKVVDKLLYKDAMEPGDLVRAISAFAATEGDREKLTTKFASLVADGLSVEYVVIVGVQPDGPEVQVTYGAVATDTLLDLRDAATSSIRGVQLMTLPSSGQAVMAGAAHGMAGARLVVFLGPRKTQEVFTGEDIRLTQILCGILSTALARVQLLNELKAQSDQIRTMGAQINHAQEQERAELSSYLHDEPLQKVAYALAQMRERSLPEDLARLLEEVAGDLRSTSAALSPELLREMGLVDTVRWAVQEQQKRNEFSIYLEFEGMQRADRFAEDIELAAYRAVQEALNNCRKHSQAKAVWVRVERIPGQLRVTVEDNGIGINAAANRGGKRPEQGLGLRGLRRRIEGLGGNLSLLPRASRGTAMVVMLPLGDGATLSATVPNNIVSFRDSA